MNATVAPIHLKLFFYLIVFKGDSYFLPQHWQNLSLPHLTIFYSYPTRLNLTLLMQWSSMPLYYVCTAYW